MTGEGSPVLYVIVTLLCFCEDVTSQGEDAPLDEVGLNRHEELVLFSCLGVVMVMSVTIVLFLWYVVDRTKDQIRHFEEHLPVIVRKFRQDIITELAENENERIAMAGVVMATGEFSAEARPLEINRGRITLASHNQDVGIGTDFSLKSSKANREESPIKEGDDASPTDQPTRKTSKAPDGAKSKDFVYVDGEYVPKEMATVERSPPIYAYDNPAYDNMSHDNPYTPDNGTGVDVPENNNQAKKKDKKKRGKKNKYSIYESHV